MVKTRYYDGENAIERWYKTRKYEGEIDSLMSLDIRGERKYSYGSLAKLKEVQTRFRKISSYFSRTFYVHLIKYVQ